MNKQTKTFTRKPASDSVPFSYVVGFLLLFTCLFSLLCYDHFPTYFYVGIVIAILFSILIGVYIYRLINPLVIYHSEEIVFKHYNKTKLLKEDIADCFVDTLPYGTVLFITSKSNKRPIVIPSKFFNLEEIQQYHKEYTN